LNNFLIEDTSEGEQLINVFDKLTSNRIIFISSFVEERLAIDVCATLMYLDQLENASNKISLYINSEGGDIRSVFMIYDTIKSLKSNIETICIGEASDESILLLTCGTKGMRYATSNSLIRLTSVNLDGPFHADMKNANIMMTEIKKDNKAFFQALSQATGKTSATLIKDAEKKISMTASQAKAYKIVDKII